MKRYATLGDIHAKPRELWDKLLDDFLDNSGSKLIFLGDYVDSYTASNRQVLDTLNYIINLKKKFTEDIVLLWGNHEHYAWTPAHIDNPYWCSGYRPDLHYDLYEIFNQNKDLFQLAYQVDNYLWTHAGISKGWWEYDYPFANKDLYHIADNLNESMRIMEPSIFQVGRRRGGHKDVGGPLWADKYDTYKKPLDGLHQIVGHSRVDDITTYTINEDTSITYCDCLDSVVKSYIIEI